MPRSQEEVHEPTDQERIDNLETVVNGQADLIDKLFFIVRKGMAHMGIAEMEQEFEDLKNGVRAPLSTPNYVPDRHMAQMDAANRRHKR